MRYNFMSQLVLLVFPPPFSPTHTAHGRQGPTPEGIAGFIQDEYGFKEGENTPTPTPGTVWMQGHETRSVQTLQALRPGRGQLERVRPSSCGVEMSQLGAAAGSGGAVGPEGHGGHSEVRLEDGGDGGAGGAAAGRQGSQAHRGSCHTIYAAQAPGFSIASVKKTDRLEPSSLLPEARTAESARLSGTQPHTPSNPRKKRRKGFSRTTGLLWMLQACPLPAPSSAGQTQGWRVINEETKLLLEGAGVGFPNCSE